MNTQRSIQFCTAILFAFLCLGSARAAQTPAPAPAAASVQPPVSPGASAGFVSVFNVAPGYGKDPFFPKSTRLSGGKGTTITNSTTASGELPSGMVLNGLSGTKEKPLAIINNRTFAEGEESEIRVGLGLYRVRVVEIKERSVIVIVNGGTPRELALRQGL